MLNPLLLLLLSQAGEGLQLLDWSVSAKAQLKPWLGYDLVAPRVRVYFKASENNWKVRLQQQQQQQQRLAAAASSLRTGTMTPLMKLMLYLHTCPACLLL
jgi:hypothetical protein